MQFNSKGLVSSDIGNTYGFLTPFGTAKVGGIQRRVLRDALHLSNAAPHEELEPPSSRFSLARVPILITGNNIHLTDSIRDYVHKKIGHALEKVQEWVYCLYLGLGLPG